MANTSGNRILAVATAILAVGAAFAWALSRESGAASTAGAGDGATAGSAADPAVTGEPETSSTDGESTEASGDEIRAIQAPAASFVIADPDSLTDEEKLRTILLPNGDRVPALNGVTLNREAIPGSMSKKPIVSIKTDSLGRDWYVHEDGAMTSSVEVIDGLTGKAYGVVQVQHRRKGDPTKLRLYSEEQLQSQKLPERRR